MKAWEQILSHRPFRQDERCWWCKGRIIASSEARAVRLDDGDIGYQHADPTECLVYLHAYARDVDALLAEVREAFDAGNLERVRLLLHNPHSVDQ